jgi:trans-aconitate methyltransferase
MNNLWKDYYNLNVIKFRYSLYKQVGKTVNGIAVDDKQLKWITQNIISKLRLCQTDEVIDLCCGNGLITRDIAESASKIIGVDFSCGLIETAKSKSSAENITYVESDVLNLTDDFFKQASKYYMYEALQHFCMERTRMLLKKVSCRKGPVLFFIGSVPDKEKLWHYYDTVEKKEFYLKRERENKPHMGRWWKRDELESVATQYGFKAHFCFQPPSFYTAYYRFDCLLEKD